MKKTLPTTQQMIIEQEDALEELRLAWIDEDTAENEKLYLDAKRDLELAYDRRNCDSCQKSFDLADLVDPGSGATFCKDCLSEEIKENNQAEYTGDDN